MNVVEQMDADATREARRGLDRLLEECTGADAALRDFILEDVLSGRFVIRAMEAGFECGGIIWCRETSQDQPFISYCVFPCPGRTDWQNFFPMEYMHE